MDYVLLAPGPVNLHPEVRKALSLPMIHHRTPEFDKILKRVLQNLKTIFQTEQDVFVLSSTGSGGMEALLVNTVSPGEKIIVINSGKFGERWAQMAKAFGMNVIEHVVPWGEAVNTQDIENLLSQNPDCVAVCCQACETSTAIVNPIRALGEIVARKPNTLFLVDGITALGAFNIEMDNWNIDGLVGGSQKAFMLPTGLSLFSFSEKAFKRIPSVTTPRYYFDVRLEKKANQNGETFFSSNVALIRALDVVFNLIAQDSNGDLSAGLKKLFQTIHSRAQFVRDMAPYLKLNLYAKAPSDSVTALEMPPHIDGQKVRALLEEKHNITIMGGQDQAKGKIIRVGHMGYIQYSENQRLIEAIASVLNDLDSNWLNASELQNLKRAIESWSDRV